VSSDAFSFYLFLIQIYAAHVFKACRNIFNKKEEKK